MTPERALNQAARMIDILREALATLRRENLALKATLEVKDGAQRTGRVVRVCCACGEEFTVRLGDMRAGHTAGKYCSRTCAGTARKEMP